MLQRKVDELKIDIKKWVKDADEILKLQPTIEETLNAGLLFKDLLKKVKIGFIETIAQNIFDLWGDWLVYKFF